MSDDRADVMANADFSHLPNGDEFKASLTATFAAMEENQGAVKVAAPDGRPTATEVFYSMNFFDEQTVFKAFGCDVMEFAPDPATKKGGRPMMFLRALALVHIRRTAENHAAAWKQASALTFQDLESYFTEEEPELDESEPETDQGKEPSDSE